MQLVTLKISCQLTFNFILITRDFNCIEYDIMLNNLFLLESHFPLLIKSSLKVNKYLADYKLQYYVYSKNVKDLTCRIFRPVFECCAPQTLVEICIFNSKKLKKGEKARNLLQNSAKKNIFFLLTIKNE